MSNLHLDEHISRHFNEELENIKARMLQMGGLVENQLANALLAIEDKDSQLAEQVLLDEDVIDEMEVSIDEACTMILARRQPAASDLRLVLAVAKTVRDLERMGDEAAKIAKMAISLAEEGDGSEGFVELRHLGTAVKGMLSKTLDAFARFDAKSAIIVLQSDKQIDQDYKSALRELISCMMEDPRKISRALNVMWALRALERIGDHSKNVCEQVVFLVRGKDIRHSQL